MNFVIDVLRVVSYLRKGTLLNILCRTLKKKTNKIIVCAHYAPLRGNRFVVNAGIDLRKDLGKLHQVREVLLIKGKSLSFNFGLSSQSFGVAFSPICKVHAILFQNLSLHESIHYSSVSLLFYQILLILKLILILITLPVSN